MSRGKRKQESAPESEAPVLGGIEGIYAFEMSTGHIKIGRSNHLPDRLRRHADHVMTYGAEIVQVWTVAVSHSITAERLLKRMLLAREGAEPVNRGLETWTGVSFVEVVTTATALFRNPAQLRLADGAEIDARPPSPPAESESVPFSPLQPSKRTYLFELLVFLEALTRGEDAVSLKTVNTHVYHDTDRALIRGRLRRQWIKFGEHERPGYTREDIEAAMNELVGEVTHCDDWATHHLDCVTESERPVKRHA